MLARCRNLGQGENTIEEPIVEEKNPPFEKATILPIEGRLWSCHLDRTYIH